jgi:Ca2+-binding RTX toxin-like protein
MRKRRILIVLFAFLVLIVVVSSYAMTSANTVPVTALEDSTKPISIGDFFPMCAGFPLDEIIFGPFPNNTYKGDKDRNCIIGTNADETIKGGAGADVIYGGGGNDNINGQGGRDYIDGGPGIDTCSRKNQDTVVNCEYYQ